MPAGFIQIEHCLLKLCSGSAPLLLALSGGPDSLYLFYALLFFREQHQIPFHVAHVDHRWRQESEEEAKILHQLALQYQVPFHLKVLDPKALKGNLEAACREERYAFFAQLYHQISSQALLVGHHRDDQAETILKRVLEGAHWSRWLGLRVESWIKGMRVLRPLLHMTKNEILSALERNNLQAFDDPSNRQLRFLRARLRETIIPHLNREFGKHIQNSLIAISEEAQELTNYFNTRLASLLKCLISGPWGAYLDLQTTMPNDFLEIKYLLRLLCKQRGLFLSREIIEQAAQALKEGKANQLFIMGSHKVWVDRKRVFLISSPSIVSENETLPLRTGNYKLDGWELKISEDVYRSSQSITSWKEGWQGYLVSYLPIKNYEIGFKEAFKREIINIKSIKKRWNQFKVPAFFYTYFPLICEDKEICYEFLTGKPLLQLDEGTPCWKIELTYSTKN